MDNCLIIRYNRDGSYYNYSNFIVYDYETTKYKLIKNWDSFYTNNDMSNNASINVIRLV